MTRATDAYFSRFGFCPRQISAPHAPRLSLIVVIPCFNEPDLITTLESLRQCERPNTEIEVIVVINSSADASSAVVQQNERTLAEARGRIDTQRDPKLTTHLIHAPDLPPRHAGVGLARKIGMDEALRRFDDAGRLDGGIIACSDADSTCAVNYLRAVANHFEANPDSPACSIYFEHPLTGDLAPEIYNAVTQYELHLRYYVQALRYAGFPHAYHTIGSSMAVRARAYMEQGGMNRRQAGEDFYFLHKLIPLGGFSELNATTVYASPRASNRVPFGTGRAVSESLEGRPPVTYPLQAFDDLRIFLQQVPELAKGGTLSNLPESIRTFLASQKFDDALDEIRRNSSTPETFTKRFFRWFDGFRAMKYIHHARDRYYGPSPVLDAAATLSSRLAPAVALPASALELVLHYRALDRAGTRIGQPDRTCALNS